MAGLGRADVRIRNGCEVQAAYLRLLWVPAAKPYLNVRENARKTRHRTLYYPCGRADVLTGLCVRRLVRDDRNSKADKHWVVVCNMNFIFP